MVAADEVDHIGWAGKRTDSPTGSLPPITYILLIRIIKIKVNRRQLTRDSHRDNVLRGGHSYGFT